MIGDFFNLFLIISALHGFLFNGIIYFSNKPKNIRYINFLVFVISMNNFQSWILIKNYFDTSYTIEYFHIPWHFLITPVFYLFLIHYLEIEKKTYNFLTLIVVVFLGLIAVRVGIVYYYSSLSYQEFKSIMQNYASVEEVFSLIFSLFVFAYSYFILQKRKEFFTQILSYDNLKWIYSFFKFGVLNYLFWAVALVMTMFTSININIQAYYPLRIITTILIYWLGYQTIIRSKIISQRKYLRQKNISETKRIPFKTYPPHQEEPKIGISESTVENILKGLETFELEKRYTSCNVTLNSLAKELDTNTNYLSKIINHYKNNSFSNYLNMLRVENIVFQLENDIVIRKFTIKAIAQESGFNNANTFSKCFLKIKGVTPYEFIQNLN